VLGLNIYQHGITSFYTR